VVAIKTDLVLMLSPEFLIATGSGTPAFTQAADPPQIVNNQTIIPVERGSVLRFDQFLFRPTTVSRAALVGAPGRRVRGYGFVAGAEFTVFPATFLLRSGLAYGEASMTKMMRLGFAFSVLMLLSTYPLAAQTAAPSASPKAGAPGTATHKSPCWQQAGISQSAMQQRKQIEENTHSQVESVCSDSSLTPQQKQQKIHQLHEEAQKQIGGLITPQQEQERKSCRASRGEAPHMGGMHAGGPCGEMATGNRPQPAGQKPQPQ